MFRNILLAGILVLCCFSASGCATAPYTGRSQLIFMNTAEEKRLGQQASNKIQSEEKVERGTKRAQMVERVGTRIAAVAERPDFVWEFLTIQKDEVNAFCLPGGKVFVYTGILEIMGNNEAELAAVMGHEIAHAIARHGAESSSVGTLAGVGQLGVALAEAIFTGGSGLSDASGTALKLGVVLPHSRTQEEEADYIGLMLMAKAGYNPEAAISFWQKMADANTGKEPLFFLSTHPLNQERINNIRKDLPKARVYYEQSGRAGRG